MSQAEAARAVQIPQASGRVRQLDAVDGDRVNGHKAIHKAKHLLLKEEGDIYYLKRGRQRDMETDIERERQRHVYTRQEMDRRERVKMATRRSEVAGSGRG